MEIGRRQEISRCAAPADDENGIHSQKVDPQRYIHMHTLHYFCFVCGRRGESKAACCVTSLG